MRISLFSWLLFIQVFFTVTFCVNVALLSAQCQSDQQSLLLQLKNSLKFSSSSVKLARWNQSTDCCQWNGVSCDEEGHVIGVDLSEQMITGGLENSSSIFSLKYLQSLNLSFNRFNNSQIPSQIGKLANLTHLNFSNAGFGGQIPIEVSHLERLVSLDFSTFYPGLRSLELKNPNLKELVQNLTRLIELHLDGVRISLHGEEWCRALSSSLPNLRVLSMSNCNLSGPIDSSLLNLQFLSIIRLDKNNFSTSVPDFFGNFSNLISLRISNSGLSGRLPGRVFQLQALQTLDLSYNELLLGFLLEFPKNASLQTLVLSYTNFSGQLPESFGYLTMLSRIELTNCSFSGPIPSSVANLTQLVFVDLSFNQFNGSIPSFGMSKNLTQINLSHNKLTGQIPAQWAGLQNLVNIDLRNNMLRDRIPSYLFLLPSLQKIQLSNNQFSGQLDDNMSSQLLDTLDLSSNNLEGPIPKSLFELRGLKILLLSHNKFNGTMQLAWIQSLRNLTSLDLSYNRLSIIASGNYSTFPSFPQLTTLKLASCKLKMFPDLKKQSKLVSLDLSNNQIPGLVPSWIWSIGNGSLTQLNLSCNLLVHLEEPYVIHSVSVLDLHSNLLSGKLPKLPPSAIYLDYSSNSFISHIPADTGSFLSYAIFFSLSNNTLAGSIPESICSAAYLQVLDLSNNKLSGRIPECLINMSRRLGVLNLRRNNLSGTIPKTFPGTCVLQTFDLNGNQLEGRIPRSLTRCTKLEVFNIGNNQIHDIFPCHLKNLSNLRVLVLRSNQFYGSIGCPENEGPWRQLQIVDLASNNFTGGVPGDCLKNWKAMVGADDETHDHIRFEFLHFNGFYYQDAITVTYKGLQLEFVKILTVLTSIDFSFNNFEGAIPEVIGDFRRLYVLNLSHNAFTGRIPSVVGNLKQLESLDLSWNKLTEEIPVELTKLSFLSFLNLSNNQLVGKIPTGTQLQTFSEASFQGNKGLCGPPLRVPCANTAPSPSELSKTQYTALKDEFDWQFIFTGLGYGAGAGATVAPLMFCRKASQWVDGGIDKFLLVLLPMLGLMYTTSDQRKAEAEEDLKEDKPDGSDKDNDYDDDDDDDYKNEEEEEFRGRYCVHCSKLDITRKRVIHDLKCICHETSPISSSSTSSSFSYSP